MIARLTSLFAALQSPVVLCVLAGIQAGMLLFLAVQVRKAPRGTEDERGFHEEEES